MSAGIVIVGGQAAGLGAATAARRRNSSTPITVVEASEHAGIGVCGLPFLFSGEVPSLDRLVLHAPGKIEKRYRVRLLTRHRAVAVHPGKRVVVAESLGGERVEVPYDRLVAATGARPVVPPEVAALGPEGVFTLRGLDDAPRLLERLRGRGSRSVLVLGAGTLGVEMANIFRERGLATTLAEQRPALLPDWEPEASVRLASILAERGVQVFSGGALVEVGRRGEGFAFRLEEGGWREADFLFCACGVRPETAFLKELPLRFHPSGALLTDERMETAVPGLYAAGDCAAVPAWPDGAPATTGTATRAAATGRVAGENAAGYEARAETLVNAWCLRLQGLELFAAGLTTREARQAGRRCEATALRARARPPYLPGDEAAWVMGLFNAETRALLGVHALGPPGTVANLQPAVALIAAGVDANRILQLEFPYTPPLGSLRHPLQQLAREYRKNAW